MAKTFLHTFIGWIAFSLLLSIALLVSSYFYSKESLLEVLSARRFFNFWLVQAILTLTGFIVFGFMKGLFASWFRQKNRTNVLLIAIFYILILATYLLTFLMAKDGIPRHVLIDTPLMMAAVTLVMGIIPYFQKHLFSARLVF